jgi:hypothetical protein
MNDGRDEKLPQAKATRGSGTRVRRCPKTQAILGVLAICVGSACLYFGLAAISIVGAHGRGDTSLVIRGYLTDMAVFGLQVLVGAVLLRRRPLSVQAVFLACALSALSIGLIVFRECDCSFLGYTLERSATTLIGAIAAQGAALVLVLTARLPRPREAAVTAPRR